MAGGPWVVLARADRPLTLHVVTNAWHGPRAALIARSAFAALHGRGRERAQGLGNVSGAGTSVRGLFRVVLDSYRRQSSQEETKDLHLREGLLLASRVVHRDQTHFQALFPSLGPELREVGQNMRRWALKHTRKAVAHSRGAPPGHDPWDPSHRSALAHSLLTAIKQQNRVAAHAVLAQVCMYVCSSKRTHSITSCVE